MRSFFRNSGEDSSYSESSSEEDIKPEVEEPSTKDSNNDSSEVDELFRTESLPSNASIAVSDTTDGNAAVSSTDQHRDNLMGALLLEHYKTKVYELLPKHSSIISRDSPEVVQYAQQLCSNAIGELQQANIMSGTPSSAPGSQQSGQYTHYLNTIGLKTMGGMMASSDQLRLQGSGANNLALVPAAGGQINNVLLDLLSANGLGSVSMPSPYSDMALSTVTPRQHSHYDSSFQQLRLLGKGGFGKVYHAHSVFDKKEYAIKKIPLSQRLTLKYQQGGLHELESVLREVQALAQLDHYNVVRYHATWIEEPKSAPSPTSNRPPARPMPQHRLLTHRPHSASVRTVDASDNGIVFGDSSRRGSLEAPVSAVQGWSINEIPDKLHDKSTSMRESQLFTDGFAKGSSSTDSNLDDTVCVLHVQMSLYPMTLSQYLAPVPPTTSSPPSSPPRRHCFHLVPSLRIILGILSGLQYVHSLGLIHRDVKPGNIFLSMHEDDTPIAASTGHKNGFYSVGHCHACATSEPEAEVEAFAKALHINPRIGDFGLVAELARSDVHLDAADPMGSSSRSAKAVGTEYYRPPPVAAVTDSSGNTLSGTRPPPIDEKIDVYALGVILVELLWRCDTAAERLHVLRDLQRGRLPRGFVEGLNAEAAATVSATETELSIRTGDKVAEMIRGMLEADSSKRLGCREVREKIMDVLQRSV